MSKYTNKKKRFPQRKIINRSPTSYNKNIVRECQLFARKILDTLEQSFSEIITPYQRMKRFEALTSCNKPSHSHDEDVKNLIHYSCSPVLLYLNKVYQREESLVIKQEIVRAFKNSLIEFAENVYKISAKKTKNIIQNKQKAQKNISELLNNMSYDKQTCTYNVAPILLTAQESCRHERNRAARFLTRAIDQLKNKIKVRSTLIRDEKEIHQYVEAIRNPSPTSIQSIDDHSYTKHVEVNGKEGSFSEKFSFFTKTYQCNLEIIEDYYKQSPEDKDEFEITAFSPR
jgi:hypothetical protein